MAELEKLELKVDTGAVTVPVIDSDGEKIGSFKFNPNDFDILRRYENVANALDSIEIPENPGCDDLFKISDEIKNQMNYLLNYNVSDDLFVKCNPLTLTKDGDLFVEKVIDGIAGLIEKTSNQRLEKRKAKIKKATARYHS